jgi:hypothetical protein
MEMTKVTQILVCLIQDGYNNKEISNFLCDGEAMARIGLDDSDQSEVEAVLSEIQTLNFLRSIK